MTDYVIRITSAWCIGAYVRTIRPFSLVSFPHTAKRFKDKAAARAYAAKLPKRIASFAPPTTFKLERREK